MAQPPTEEEKERFLEYIRGGDDRATAAWRINPEYTGRIFRAMCNPTSKRHYDPDFAKAYDEAVAFRGPLDPHRQQIVPDQREPSSTTTNGFTKAMHLTEGQLDEFLELIRDGEKPAAAAGKITPPTSMTQIHRRAGRDPSFASDFREAKEEGYEAYKESLRAEAARQAFAGDYRALRDQMLMHLEEASKLITSRHEVGGLEGGAIRVLAERHFADLPRELLDELIRNLEERELGQRRELEAGE